MKLYHWMFSYLRWQSVYPVPGTALDCRNITMSMPQGAVADCVIDGFSAKVAFLDKGQERSIPPRGEQRWEPTDPALLDIMKNANLDPSVESIDLLEIALPLNQKNGLSEDTMVSKCIMLIASLEYQEHRSMPNLKQASEIAQTAWIKYKDGFRAQLIPTLVHTGARYHFWLTAREGADGKRIVYLTARRRG